MGSTVATSQSENDTGAVVPLLDFCIIFEDDDQERALVFIGDRLVYRGRVPVELTCYLQAITETFEGLSRTSECEVAQPPPRRVCP